MSKIWFHDFGNIPFFSSENIDYLLTTSPLELSSEVLQSGPWMQTREVKLVKLPDEQTWGLRFTGKCGAYLYVILVVMLI